MTELEHIVAAAISLHDEDRDLRKLEFDLGVIEAGLVELDLSTVAQICRRLAAVQSISAITFPASCTLHAGIRNRAANTTDLPGATDMTLEHAAEAHALGERQLALRSQLRMLDAAMGSAIVDLRDQDIDERLLRIAAGDGVLWDVDALLEAVRADHHAIADAMGDWRTMNARGPVLMIAGSSTRDDINAAIGRLERRGHAVRHLSMIHGWRWTLSASKAKTLAA